jgi:phosphinothricin acetyltransferase
LESAVTPSIRLARAHDAEQVQAIYASFCTSTPVSFELVAPSVEEMRGRIVDTLQRFPWLVADHQGEVLGYVYASPHRQRAAYQWSVDVAAYIRQGRRRLGVGRALYTSLFDLLVLQGFYNAFAGISLPNPASVGLHEALGFQLVGVYRAVGYKCDAWHDVSWWQRLLRPPTQVPAPLRDLPAVRDLAEFKTALASGLPLLRPMA